MTQSIFSKGREKNPIISIVTVCLNSEKNLEETILSVLNQTYKKIEYAIIDGGSTDNTLDIVKKYENKIDYWISEKDEGIYHAMNKGISVASGEILHFLNAGDCFYNDKILELISKEFIKNKNIGIVYGLTECFSNDIGIEYIAGGKINKEKLWKGMPVCHQSIFFKKELFEKIGPYDTRFKSMADYEFILRFFNNYRSHGFKVYFLNMPLCKFDLYGFSSKNYLKNLDEIERVSKSYYRFGFIHHFYFFTKRIKFFLLVFMNKLKISGLYRKVKYNVIYKKIKKKEYD